MSDEIVEPDVVTPEPLPPEPAKGTIMIVTLDEKADEVMDRIKTVLNDITYPLMMQYLG